MTDLVNNTKVQKFVNNAIKVDAAHSIEFLAAARDSNPLEQTDRNGPWYTSRLTGEKARGAAKAEEMVKEEINGIIKMIGNQAFSDLNEKATDEQHEAMADDIEAAETVAAEVLEGEPKQREGVIYVETIEEAKAVEPGKQYYIKPNVTLRTPTGATFKNDQPLITIICRECGARRPVHVQDAPQVDERCHACIVDARQRRRNLRRRANRWAAQNDVERDSKEYNRYLKQLAQEIAKAEG